MSTTDGTMTTPSPDAAPRAVVGDAEGGPSASARDAVSVRTPEFAELSATPAPAGSAALDNLLAVTVTVTAELGRATTTIGELLKLNVGSVVELDRLVSEPVELLARGVRLARGEVVVVDERFAVRIKEIVDAKKRA